MKALALLILTCCAQTAQAAAGATAFDFLNLGVGARQVAMGQAGTAVADDLPGSYMNPAGLSQLSRQEVSFLYSSQFADITYQHLGYARPTAQYGSFAIGLFSLDYGQISGYDATGTRTGDVSAWDRMLNLGYGKALSKKASLGANLRYFQEKLGSDKAQAAALDLGLLTWPLRTGPLAGLSAGLSLKNMGPGAKFDQRSESLPFTVQAGLAYKALQDCLTLALDLAKPKGENVGVHLGGELWIKDVVAMRAGYDSEYGIGSGFSFGAGVKFMDFQFDYAFVNLSDLGNINRVGLTYRFGNLAAAYYSQGMHKMQEGRYAEAIMEFDKALAIDPNYEKALLRIREAHQKLREKFSEREP